MLDVGEMASVAVKTMAAPVPAATPRDHASSRTGAESSDGNYVQIRTRRMTTVISRFLVVILWVSNGGPIRGVEAHKVRC